MTRPRALSGIQPSGTPHIGNLLGMIEPAIRLQETHEAFYFVADYHALTTTHDSARLAESVYELTATFLAFGLDVDRTAFYRQSQIPEVTELAWILACVTSVGSLERAHAYKAALASRREVNAGTFMYPVLMAADILACRSNVVPVGRDQKQHVEMARDMAQRFNHLFGETLTIPEPLIKDEVATVPGLDGQKMSKSYNNTIAIFEAPAELKRKIGGIITDSTPLDQPKDPEKCHIFALYSLFAEPAEVEEMARRYRAGGYGYGQAKADLIKAMERKLSGPAKRYRELMSSRAALDEVLARGADRARKEARATLDLVRRRVGF